MSNADIVIVGGGVAGLSAAARLAPHCRTVVVESEEAIGHHSSGRSATLSHFGIGNGPVRGLTSHSRSFFLDPPADFAAVPLSRPTSALFVAREEALPALAALHAEMARYTDTVAPADHDRIRSLCPIVKTGTGAVVGAVEDRGGLKLDGEALLQGYAREVKRHGGEILNGRRIASIGRTGSEWRVESASGEAWTAPILINAAGAWADSIAEMAGVRPIGLMPMRRTIIVVDPPVGQDVRDWPFVRSVADDFYMLPESGRLLASPSDEVPSDPCDAQPEEYDLALAAYRLEEYTSLSVSRIAHRWAGLRSFAADRVPTAGFAPDAAGFFWLAGQGGYGLQTAPAMAAITEALILGQPWPAALAALGVMKDVVGPERLVAA